MQGTCFLPFSFVSITLYNVFCRLLSPLLFSKCLWQNYTTYTISMNLAVSGCYFLIPSVTFSDSFCHTGSASRQDDASSEAFLFHVPWILARKQPLPLAVGSKTRSMELRLWLLEPGGSQLKVVAGALFYFILLIQVVFQLLLPPPWTLQIFSWLLIWASLLWAIGFQYWKQ